MRTAFMHKASAQLSDLYYQVRKSNAQPDWLGDTHWNELNIHWGTQGFQAIFEINSQNRNSNTGALLHAGGCTSSGTIADRMVR